MKTNAIKPMLKVVLPYLFFGVVYILYSDKFVQTISADQNTLTQLQTYKGWGFILLTSFLLVIMLFRFFDKLGRERNGLELLKETLSRSENLYHSLFMNSGEAIILTNRDGSLKAANPEACRIFDRTEEKICSLGWDALIDTSDPRSQLAIEKRTQNGIFKGELTFLRKDGTMFPGDVVTTSFKDMNGVVRTSTIIRDISEKKRAEIELQENEERYRSLFVNMIEGFAYCKMIYKDGIPYDIEFIKSNEKLEALTGLTNVDGKKISEIIPSFYKDNPEVFEICGRVASSGNPEHFETFVPVLNGWYSVSVYSTKINYFVAMFELITERKQTELALIKNRRFLADLIENSGTLIFVKNFEGIYELVNKKWEAITGLRRDDVIGKTDSELFPGINGRRFRQNDLEVMQLGKLIESEEVLTKENGTIYFISIKFPTFDEEGKVNGICGISTEITERKLAEEALRESEERFRSIVEGAPDAIFIQADSKFIFLNPAAYELFGYDSADGIIDTEVIDHVHPDYRLITSERIKKLNTERKPVVDLKEQIFLKKDGSELWVETKGEPIPYKGNQGALVFVRNISQRKKVEKDLRESEEKYRTITENINDVVWILDTVTERFMYVSPSVYSLLGYTTEEIMEKSVYDVLTQESANLVKKLSYQRVTEFLDKHDSERTFTNEVEQKCKDGTTIWTEVVTSLYKNEKTGNINIRGVTRDISERKKIQDALSASEERFRSTLDNMLEGCQIMDLDWRYVYINNTAEIHNRRSKSELLGKRYMDIWPGIENTFVFYALKNCMEEKKTRQFENKFSYPDGSEGWFDLSIQPVSEGVFILSIDITDRKKAEQDILDSRENLRALTARLEKVREEERMHLSRELHDHLGQNLTGLKMDVANIEKHLRFDSRINVDNLLLKTKVMVDLIDDLIKNVRKISSELRPNVLDYLGLIPAIEWQIEEFTKRTEIKCIYDSNTSKIDLGMEINSSIFRIIQEAFTNIIRHSKATKVNIRINDKDDYILIEIQDNGIGIQPEEISNFKSLGILGMQERTLNFKGKLQIEKASKGGTVLSLTIPKLSII